MRGMAKILPYPVRDEFPVVLTAGAEIRSVVAYDDEVVREVASVEKNVRKGQAVNSCCRQVKEGIRSPARATQKARYACDAADKCIDGVASTTTAEAVRVAGALSEGKLIAKDSSGVSRDSDAPAFL